MRGPAVKEGNEWTHWMKHTEVSDELPRPLRLACPEMVKCRSTDDENEEGDKLD